MAIIISDANKGLYEAWFAKALADDAVWPYMTFDKLTEIKKIENGDWVSVILMDDTQNAVLSWSQDRDNGMHSASISLWSLNGTRRAVSAGHLCQLLPSLARRYGVSYIDAACHASNDASKAILTKRFGQPWGVKPDGAWNGLIGRFEDSLHFRVPA